MLLYNRRDRESWHWLFGARYRVPVVMSRGGNPSEWFKQFLVSGVLRLRYCVAGKTGTFATDAYRLV